MSYEKITCRIAIQMCVGHFPDGRERHRTISLRHVRPDVSFETVLDLARAIAPVLTYPITKVTKVTKIVLFSCEEQQGAEHAAPCPATLAPPVDAEPVPDVPAKGRIIPFPVIPVTAPPAACRAISRGVVKPTRFVAREKRFLSGRAPPAISAATSVFRNYIFRVIKGDDSTPNIKSGTDLRNSCDAISTFCHESREPVFLSLRTGRVA